jgi:ribosome-associated protein
MAIDQSVNTAIDAAVKAAWHKGATEFVALDVSENLVLTDAFVLMSGRSERNTKAIADAIEDELHQEGIKLLRKEGKADGRWVLLDFGYFVVHVFHEDERQFYVLERLWKDSPVIPLQLPDGEQPSAE